MSQRLKFFNKGRESASVSNESEELNDTQAILKAVNLNKVLIIGVLALCGVMYQDISAIKEDNKTIMMWPNGASAWVTGTDVDSTYTRMMTGYLITMWGNISSSTADAQFGEILKFAHPFYHSELRAKLQVRAEQVKQYKTVTLTMTSALGEGVEITKERLKEHRFKKISTPVYKVSYLTRTNLLYNNKQDPTPDEKTLVFYFTVDNGSSFLLDIEEYMYE